MGGALIKGLMQSGKVDKGSLYVYDVYDKALENIRSKWGVKTVKELSGNIFNADIIILAIKPKDIDDVLKVLSGKIERPSLLVSIVAGISTEYIKSKISGSVNVGRVMPNTPALIGMGVSAIADDCVDKKELDLIQFVFSCVGETVTVPEKHINAVTGLSGSGPAYVYMFIEALIEGGVSNGLSVEVAKKLAINTVIGGAKLALYSDSSLKELRRAVSSPGGTTVAGCSTLEEKGFNATVISAVESAVKRSFELSKSN